MINRLPLQSQIITFIYNYIKEHDLKEGDKLPSQAALAGMMGVSTPSLREAIKTLEAKNVVQVRNGKGIYIKSARDDSFTAQIDLKKEKETLINLLYVRNVLEKEVVKLLVKNATEEELDDVESVVTVLISKYERGVRQTEEDRQFHRLLYKYCHNDVLYELIQSISDMLSKFQEYPLGLSEPFTETIPLHYDLYLALRERDVKKALSINTRINSMIHKSIDKA